MVARMVAKFFCSTAHYSNFLYIINYLMDQQNYLRSVSN